MIRCVPHAVQKYTVWRQTCVSLCSVIPYQKVLYRVIFPLVSPLHISQQRRCWTCCLLRFLCVIVESLTTMTGRGLDKLQSCNLWDSLHFKFICLRKKAVNTDMRRKKILAPHWVRHRKVYIYTQLTTFFQDLAMTLGLSRVKQQDSVVAGPKRMVVNLFLMAQTAGQSNTKWCWTSAQWNCRKNSAVASDSCH